MILKGACRFDTPPKRIAITIINLATIYIMTKINFNIAILLVLAITAIAVIGSIHAKTANASTSTLIQKMNISKGVSVGNSSTELLPASSGRVYAIIVNDGAEPLYLSMNGSAAVAGAGVRLNEEGGSYEINELNRYVGIVNGITASGTINVTVSASQ